MVTNPITPPTATFSGNFIPLKFNTDALIETEGVKSTNYIFIGNEIPINTAFPITYGGKTINMVATTSPDDSGLQLPTGDGLESYIASLIPYFKANYNLNKDFEISVTPEQPQIIQFLAYEKNYGFDFSNYNTIALSGELHIYNVNSGQHQTIKPNFGIYFELYLENASNTAYEKIYESRLPIVFGTNTDAVIDISDKLHDQLQAASLDTIADNSITPILCTKSTRKYYYRYAESWGVNIDIKAIKQSATYTVTLGKLSYIGATEKTLLSIINPLTGDATADRFLKQGTLAQSTRVNQPQFLYFFNNRTALTGAKLNVKYYYTDTNTSTEIIATLNLKTLRKYGFNVGFNKIFDPTTTPHLGKTVYKYEVWLSDASDIRKSENSTYLLDYSYKQFVRYFIFLSSFGAIESLLFYGKQSKKYDITQNEAKYITRSGYAITDGETSVYAISLNDTFKIATGWLPFAKLKSFKDFVLATEKFRCHSGLRLPIKLTSKRFEEQDDKNNLFALNIEYAYLYDDDAYTEMEEINDADIINITLYNMYYGPTITIPTNANDVKLLINKKIETVAQITLETGANKFFVIAIPSRKVLVSVLNIVPDFTENLTSEYILQNTIIIDDTTYNIYAMKLTVPYSTNQSHLITTANA